MSLGLPMETVSGVQLVLRGTCGIYDIYSSGQGGTLNVSSFRSSKYVYPAFLEVNLKRKPCYKYKYIGSYQLTYFRKFHWNPLTVIDFSSRQTKLLSQNATFSSVFDPVRFHF